MEVTVMPTGKMSKNTYRKGRIAEKKVENWLSENGFTNIRRSKGSRGPADIYARSPSGVKSYIQVKSGTASMRSDEKKRLRSLARRRKGFAAEVHKGAGNSYRMKPMGNWSSRRKKKPQENLISLTLKRKLMMKNHK
jgi:Holliday junction resolvase-like predicted endonuclease